jgi:hypothetical protein
VSVPIVVHVDPPCVAYWKATVAMPESPSVEFAVTMTLPETERFGAAGAVIEPVGPPASMLSAAVVCADSVLPALSTDQYVTV